MNTAGLSLDNVPEFRIPMGFFLSAPWFGMLAALLMLISPELISSRWHPSMLATVHLLTLGFGAMIMVGAMIQVLPVLSSQPVPAAATLSPWIRGGLASGTLFLALGFLFNQNSLFYIALALLAGVFMLFLGALGVALVRVKSGGDSVFSLRLAALCLLVTVLFGVLQLSTYMDLNWIGYSFERTDSHALLGLAGWGMLLIMGVSFQVIPMFHVAPAFPWWFCRGSSALLFITLVIALLASGAISKAALLMLPLIICFYGGYALYLIYQRKRKLVDYTIRFWQLSFTNLVLLCLVYLLHQLGLSIMPESAQFYLLLGFGFGLGFVVSVMLGMLQKIVPFLMFLHLQRACIHEPGAFMKLPNMRQLLPQSDSKWQYYLHISALATLYLSFFGGDLQYPLLFVAAALLLASFAWLFKTLWQANRRYIESMASITAK
ncbi:hypothetical protein [Amphritea balenae]|uniref:Uncharacterized protein n=1 Tax=Amphritea balenae TaxID=452629 RepID=A0A3P1SX67_9GAMM|nr:hypothetical protein [Amphritea balenae]RRD00713.1 hypothetical protein EHS89_06415 [Amphritea balenae]GGK68402.1 hypothetical protein GCM10007941_18290 [Amphritea balenae]